ncbi:Rab family GTPase [Entamoeba marina]
MAEEGGLNFKICVIGDGDIGKTSLIRKFVYDKFEEEKQPFEDASVSKDITVNENVIKLNIFDPQGDETGTTASFYNNAQCLLAVFSVEDQSTFNNCRNWLSYGDRYLGGEYLKAIVALKSEEMAKSLSCQYFEVSAKTGDGIQELFDGMVDAIYKKFAPETTPGKGKKPKKRKERQRR